MKVTFESVLGIETEVIIKGDITNPQVTSLLEYIKNQSTSNTKKMMLYKEDEQFLITPDEIIYIEVTKSRVEAVTTSDRFDTKKKLYELKDMLANEPFVQINKGTLVNLDYVKSVAAEFSGNYTLKLKNSKETLTISRKFFKEFKDNL